MHKLMSQIHKFTPIFINLNTAPIPQCLPCSNEPLLVILH